MNVPTEDISWAEAEQQRLEIKDSGYIMLYGDGDSVGAARDKYPLSSWQKIIDDIQQRQTGLTVFLLQTTENREWVTATIAANNNLVAIAPPDIGKLAAMIAGANLILCTDSVPMQLAIAVKTYTIALFGATDSKKRLSESSDNCVAIQSDSGRIADIQPETVIEKIWQS